MKLITIGILSVALLALPGCKTVTAGTSSAPTLTFAQATNASLQAAHKFGMDIAASVKSGKLVLDATQKQAFDAFAMSLNATDALFVAYESGTATQAQVSAALTNMTHLQNAAQTSLAQTGN